MQALPMEDKMPTMKRLQRSSSTRNLLYADQRVPSPVELHISLSLRGEFQS
uniref:Derlin n=1 Tax=Rhizophora mucronata TaxID=61149 RepID=A0A2P2LCF1_RHIMU